MNLYHNQPLPNYMPAYATPEDLDLSARICSDDKTISDTSGLTNRAKWEFAMSIFDCPECTLFSALSFEDVYALDDPDKAVAASYIADLRTQFLAKQLKQYPANLEVHELYIRNRQWQARFASRAYLEDLCNSSKTTMLT